METRLGNHQFEKNTVHRKCNFGLLLSKLIAALKRYYLITENLVNGELGDWPKNRSTPGEKRRSTPGDKWRSTPGDKWEVEMEVDTRRKASVTLSGKISVAISVAISVKFSTKFPTMFRKFPLILNLVIDQKVITKFMKVTLQTF